MEFDEIKNIGKKLLSENVSLNIEKEDIEKAIKTKQKTNTVLSKMKISFYIEFGLGILSVIFLLLIDIKIINYICYPLFILYYSYLVFLFNRFLRLEKTILTDNNIVQSLKKFVDYFNKFLKRYFKINIIVALIAIPFCFTIGLAVGHFSAEAGISAPSISELQNYYGIDFIYSLKFLKFFLIGLIFSLPVTFNYSAFSIGIIYLILHVFYGRHIDLLDKYRKELESE